MKQPKIFWISLCALLICTASATFAANISVIDTSDRPDWGSLGTTIWLTLLVTVPAFIVFIMTAVAAVIDKYKK